MEAFWIKAEDGTLINLHRVNRIYAAFEDRDDYQVIASFGLSAGAGEYNCEDRAILSRHTTLEEAEKVLAELYSMLPGNGFGMKAMLTDAGLKAEAAK